MIIPTFLARRLSNGDSAMQCRETGERFIISPPDPRGDCYAYHEGQLIRHGPRAVVLNAIESAARWSIRAAQSV